MGEKYERYASEVQILKKQISSEKVSHENTISQLQSAYQIIDELK